MENGIINSVFPDSTRLQFCELAACLNDVDGGENSEPAVKQKETWVHSIVEEAAALHTDMLTSTETNWHVAHKVLKSGWEGRNPTWLRF